MPRSSKFVLAFVAAAAFAVPLAACYGVAQEKKEPPADKELESLVKDLRSKDIGTRLKAIKKLADKGEDAAPAARALCDAIADSSRRVGTAALEAVEKVRPDLYKPLAKMVLDDSDYKRTAAVEEFGQMGEKASPCLGLIVARLRNELARQRVSEAAACFKAIRQIGPDAEAIKFFKLVAGSRDAYGRLFAIRALDEWTEGDEAKRKEIFPLVLRALEDGYDRIFCIRILASYGRLAKDAVPQLRKLKLSSDENIRNAASAALEEIEGQPPESKEERSKATGTKEPEKKEPEKREPEKKELQKTEPEKVPETKQVKKKPEDDSPKTVTELRKRALPLLKELAEQDGLRLVELTTSTTYSDSLKRAVANGGYHTEYYPSDDAKPRICVRTWVDRDAKLLLYSY